MINSIGLGTRFRLDLRGDKRRRNIVHSRLIIRSPHGGHALLFDQKKNCLPKTPKNGQMLFGIMNSENMSNHFSTKNFGKFQCKLRACGRDDLFLVFTCSWAGKWTSADVMTFFWSSLLGGKVDICGRDDLFCGLYLFLGRKLDIYGHDDPQKTCPSFAQ